MKLCFRQLKDCLDVDLAIFQQKNDLDKFRVEAFRENVFKKFIDNVQPDADSKALEKFLQADKACADWKLECSTMLDEYLIGEFRNEIYRFWYTSGVDSICDSVYGLYQFGRTGPGSSLGASGTDYYSKLFSSKLTTTSTFLYYLYRRGTTYSPISDCAEKARVSDFGEYDVVEGNRLHFVPKRDDISRVICVEPALNMYFQMGFKHILESRLRKVYNIDLTTQPDKNRKMAQEGSVSGKYATIDLSSASDSVGLKMLREFFPKQWVDIMMLLRSPKCQLPDGRSIVTNMVSSMGNAFTFPLETIIFRAILSAAARVQGLPISRNDLAVFGDDIICPEAITGKVLRLLKILGFSTNADKTFVEGPFRESCGHDYFYGHDVRPVYIKSLSTQQDRYIAINLLNAWTAKTGIPLVNAVGHLVGSVKRNFVPPAENLDAGILAPLSMLSKLCYDQNSSIKYRAYRANTVSIRIHKDTHKISGFKSKKIRYNPGGLLETFLRGYIRDHTIPVRNRWVVYSTKRCVSPNWDYIPTDSALGGLLNPFAPEFVKRRWNYAVYLNVS